MSKLLRVYRMKDNVPMAWRIVAAGVILLLVINTTTLISVGETLRVLALELKK